MSKESEEKKEPEQEIKPATESQEAEIPAEVDAFLKGKNKYKHPYGDWKPVIKTDPVKRKTVAADLDLPSDNWHLPENQPTPIIPEVKDNTHIKLTFKEREITGIAPSSSSKTKETTVTFKKRKIAGNRQLRGSAGEHDLIEME